MKSNFKMLAASLALATAGLAQAAPITLVPFGQTGSSSTTIIGTELAGVTTIATATPWTQVTITGIAPNTGSNATPQTGYLNLFATSNNAASVLSSPISFSQFYDGNFQISEFAGGLGNNILSGTFTNALVSGLLTGTALTLAASQVGFATLSFTTSIFPALLPPSAASFAFAAVDPTVSIVNDSLASFTASFSGTNSSTSDFTIPEPASALLVGLGMLAAMTARRRRSSGKHVA